VRIRNQFLAIGLLLAVAVAARADSPHYFDPAPFDPVKLIPPPPSEHSGEDHVELDLLIVLQQMRTPAEISRCQSEQKLTIDAFQTVLGPWCTSQNLPHAAKLFVAVAKDSKPILDAVKNHYQRPRPAHEDDKVHPSIDDDASFAYPSGHSTRGTMYALLLAELFPEHREALLERGREIGWDRVIAGLHHPSDIVAGRVLGQALAQALLADPKFQADFAAMKKELIEAEHHAAEPAASR
jgi:acid phosphatase (class A)